MNKESVCQSVRRNAERLQVAFADRFACPRLTGLCGICTLALSQAFLFRGWTHKPLFGRFHSAGREKPHCWVEDDHYRYDLTATQFGDFPDVFISPCTGPLYDPVESMEDLQIDYWQDSKRLVNYLLQGVSSCF